MTNMGLRLFLTLNMCLAAGCVAGPLDATGQDDPAAGATAQPVLGPGNPFNYSSARDEQLACFGMAVAPNFPSNCDDIVDSDDRQMCRGMSSRTTTPCFAIADRNLLLACLGMAPGPFNGSTACSGITNPDMQKFCTAYASLNSALCNQVTDSGTRFMCLSVVSGGSSFCGAIANPNDALFCQGVSDHTQTPCFSIH
jgi:hypothetical protein